MSNYGNFKQKQSNYYWIGILGFMTGFSILAYSFAQEPTIIIPTGNTYSVNTAWTAKAWKGWTWSTESSGITAVKLTTNTNWWESNQNQWIKETDKGWGKSVLVIPNWFPEDSLATQIATYEYEISNWDMDFLMTLRAENGWYNMYQQSNVYTNWVREDSWGLCQLHRKRHSNIVDDPRFFTDYKWHIEQCWIKYKNWTRFYGYDVRLKYKNDFTIID